MVQLGRISTGVSNNFHTCQQIERNNTDVRSCRWDASSSTEILNVSMQLEEIESLKQSRQIPVTKHMSRAILRKGGRFVWLSQTVCQTTSYPESYKAIFRASGVQPSAGEHWKSIGRGWKERRILKKRQLEGVSM